ncbi:MAG: RDD family protein [Actinomycetota bacterium]|nr:RDD family protein [Actinomycetota bacterium]
MALDAAYNLGFATGFGQTLGQMAMGIRIVDASSRQSPPFTRAVIRWAVAAFPLRTAGLLPPSGSVLRFEQLKPEIQRLQREHHDDRRRRDEELTELYRRHGVSFSAWFLRGVLSEALAVANLLLALRDASRRGLADRAANTLVIRAKPASNSSRDPEPGPRATCAGAPGADRRVMRRGMA